MPIIPEPNSSTVVTVVDNNDLSISNGTVVGNNLFYSFTKFDIASDKSITFSQTPNIENIFILVTGDNLSTIDGFIKTTGNANVFLINPDGLTFGENTDLTIDGSFIATTATEAGFNDGSQLDAAASESTSLPTGDVASLHLTDASGDITVLGRLNSLKTVGLLGSNLIIDNGQILAPGGKIELGAVSDSEIVNLQPVDHDFNFDYESVNSFGDIKLREQASLNAQEIQIFSADLNVENSTIEAFGGDIVLQAENIRLLNSAQVSSSPSDDISAGNIIINYLQFLSFNGKISAVISIN